MILFDLSRLLSRAGRGTPTGIDRVELAYAQHLLAKGDGNTCFAALNARGALGALPQRISQRFVAEIAAAWRGEDDPAPHDRRAWLIAQQAWIGLLAGERALAMQLRRSTKPPIYLLVSHHHLEKPVSIVRL